MMNMICKKCESRLNMGAKCFQCGFDNNSAPIVSAGKVKSKRSPVIIAVMSLFIFLSVIMIAQSIGIIFRIPALANLTFLFTMLTGVSNSIFFIGIPGVHYLVSVIITLAVAVFEIVLCIGILKLEKRAFKMYARLTVARIIWQMIVSIRVILIWPASLFTILAPYFLKCLLLFIVYMTDGKDFGGAAIHESVSAIRARKMAMKGE